MKKKRPEWSPPVWMTQRRHELLLLICDDVKSHEIADRLGISIHTFETHRHRLKKLTGTQGTAGLVRWAIRCGLIEP